MGLMDRFADEQEYRERADMLNESRWPPPPFAPILYSAQPHVQAILCRLEERQHANFYRGQIPYDPPARGTLPGACAPSSSP